MGGIAGIYSGFRKLLSEFAGKLGMNNGFDKIQAALRELVRLCDPEMPVNERKHQLNVLDKRFRIEGVYELSKILLPAETDRPEDAELEAIRQHLEPLGLAPEGTPLAELARLAALAITQK
jgi:hypothetical protein